MAKVTEHKNPTYTIELTEEEAEGLRYLLGSGVGVGALDSLGLSDLCSELSKFIICPTHLPEFKFTANIYSFIE